MYYYLLVIKAGPEESSALVREKGLTPIRRIPIQTVSCTTLEVSAEQDSTNQLNRWMQKDGEPPYPIGTLLFWNPSLRKGEQLNA